MPAIEKDINSKIQAGEESKKEENEFPFAAFAKRVLDEKESTTEKKEKEEIKDYIQKYDDFLFSMPESMKKILLCIGENGISEISDLLAAMGDEMSAAKILACVNSLGKKKLLRGEKLKLPLTAQLNVFWLSNWGKNLYRHMAGREPAESKAERFRKEYATLEYGYSISEVVAMLNQTNFAKNMGAEASCIHGRKQIKLPDGKTFVPDITITSGNKVLMYIEYETAKCTEADFIDKCSKFVQVSDSLNFIVPGKKEMEKVKDHIEKWMETEKEKNFFLDFVTIRVGTPQGIKAEDNDNKNADSLSWEWESQAGDAKPKH